MEFCHTEPHVAPRQGRDFEDGHCKRKRTRWAEGGPVETANTVHGGAHADLASWKKCHDLRAFLFDQFHQKMGHSSTGGPNCFVIEIADISRDLFLLLTGHVPQQHSSVSIARPSTRELLSVPHLDSVRKQGIGGFFRPCPTCAVKYDNINMILVIRGYTEFVPG